MTAVNAGFLLTAGIENENSPAGWLAEVFKGFSLYGFLLMIGKSAAVLVAAYVLTRICKGLINRMVLRGSKTIRSGKLDTIRTVLISVVKFTVYAMAFLTVLSILGLYSSYVVAVAGIGSVAVGLASQSLVKDVINGIFILVENLFDVGDEVSIGVCKGTVEAIGVRSTKLRSKDGDLHIIPNSEIRVITKIGVYQKEPVEGTEEPEKPYEKKSQ